MKPIIESIMFIITAMVKFHQDNVRVVSFDFPTLWGDIAERGLLTEPWVHVEEDGSHTVIRGHRRIGALLWGKVNDPERFNERFPDGKVSLRVYSGLSKDEITILRNDHGNTKGLVAGEALKAMCQLYGANYTQAQVIASCLGMLEETFPPASDKKGAKAISLRSEAARISSKKDMARRNRLLLEADKLSREHYHGTAGLAQQVFRLRHTVAFDSYITQRCGVSVKTPMTVKQVTSLDQKLTEDKKAGASLSTKSGLGPISQAYWDAMVKKAKDPKTPKSKKTGPTPLGAKAMEDKLLVYRSCFVKAGIMICQGKIVADADELDALAYKLELAFGHAPDAVEGFLDDVIRDNAETVVDAEVEAKA